MKKKLFSLIAALSCFACLGGCLKDNSGNKDSTPTTSEAPSTGDYNLESAKAIVKAMYFTDAYVNNNVDYEYPTSIPIGGVTYTIQWSVDVAEGVVVEDKGATALINVDEAATTAINYVLTAKIFAPDGTSIEQKFERTVKAISQYVTAVITGKPAENTAYKYHVYQSTLAKDMYFAGEMDGYYFKTTENIEEAVELYVEHIADSDNFYVYFTDAAGVKQYIGVRLSDDGAHNNIVYDTTPVSEFYWSETYGTIITTIPVDKDGNANTEFYLGNYASHKTISASTVSYFGGSGNNTGHLVGLVDRTQISDEDKVSVTANALVLNASYQGGASYDLPDRGDMYPETVISWACDNELVAINGNSMTLNSVNDATQVTLVATISCGDASQTKEITITITSALPADGTTLTIPQALELGAPLTSETTQKYYISGKITGFYGTNGTTYGNVYIQDAEGNEILIYGLYNEDGSTKYGDMENKPVVGDTIKVYGALTAYQGAAQFKNAWLIEHTVGGGEEGGDVVEGAYELDFSNVANRTSYDSNAQVWEQNGVKVTNNKAGSTTNVADYSNPARFYKNSEVVIEYPGMTKIVIESADNINTSTYLDNLKNSLTEGTVTADGTTITIVLASAQNSYTFTASGGQVRFYSVTVYAGEGSGEVTPPEGGEEGGETPAPDYTVMSIPEALEAADGTKIEVSGTVCEINTVWNEQFGNITVTITDAQGNKLYVYRLATNVELGDIVTIKGEMATYNGRQVGAGATAVITGKDNSYSYSEMTIVEALAAADGTNVIVTGTVSEIKTAYSEQYGNISVDIVDENGNVLYLYRLSGNVEVGNVIKVTGTMATYNSNRQLTGGTYELISEGEAGGETPSPEVPPVEHEHNFVEGKCECGAEDPNYVAPEVHEHNFVEGKCECGAEDPNYVAPEVHEHNFVEGKCECGAEDPNYVAPKEEITTIAGALAGAEGDKATFTGTISEIYQAWNTQYSNMSFYVTDGTDRILVFRAGTLVGIGDEVSVSGTVTVYNEVNQIAQGSTVTITAAHVCSTFTEADCNNAAVCTICGLANGEALGHIDADSDGTCDRCPTEMGVATITASKTVAELITQYGWTSSTTKQEFNLDDVVSVKVNGGSNSGKAYNGDHIRIYATDSPAGTLTISLAEGYELVSVKVTTQTGTYAYLCVDGTTTDICNTTTNVSGSSVVLNSVKNGSDGKQVRVTAIEVVYKAV